MTRREWLESLEVREMERRERDERRRERERRYKREWKRRRRARLKAERFLGGEDPHQAEVAEATKRVYGRWRTTV
jgi:hypothetical protein